MNIRNFRLEQKTKRRYFLLRLELGCKALFSNRKKQIYFVGYLLLAFIVWTFRVELLGISDADNFGAIKLTSFENLFRVGWISGLTGMIMLFGIPLGGRSIHENLQRIGFTNSAGETPLLVSSHADKDNPNVRILEFEANGIPLTDWENRRDKIEAALNIYAAKIKEGENKRRILLYSVSAGKGLPQVLYWHDSCLNPNSFILVMGESFTGQVSVNLAQIPHILLGGSTGSGKSVLLKLLLMQCVKKGAVVHIADFKGGVDFPRTWHNQCKIIFDKTALLDTLSSLVEELEQRKKLLKSADCANIESYNRETGASLSRMIFACDEVAEVLDKTGLDKQSKELVAQIESNLSTIARQGRAFGVHLILATQRPDSTILSGQIRNNIDCRVCGRADNVLSQIILDSTAASDQIPKDSQGRFIMHDGTVFQGYLFDESVALRLGGF